MANTPVVGVQRSEARVDAGSHVGNRSPVQSKINSRRSIGADRAPRGRVILPKTAEILQDQRSPRSIARVSVAPVEHRATTGVPDLRAGARIVCKVVAVNLVADGGAEGA